MVSFLKKNIYLKFTNIFSAAFVGIPGNFPYQALPGALVFLHLFASAFVLPLHDFSLDRVSTPQIISLITFSGLKVRSKLPSI